MEPPSPPPDPSNQEPSRGPESDSEPSHPLLKDIMSEFPDIRQDRIAALRSAIESGTYSVPAQDLADKILQELLRNPPQNPPSASS